MSIQMINSFLFTQHFLLLVINIALLWVIWKRVTLTKAPSSSKYMLIFSLSNLSIVTFFLMVAIFQAYFMISFFVPLDLYYYEFIAVTHEIVLSYLIIKHLVKEETNG